MTSLLVTLMAFMLTVALITTQRCPSSSSTLETGVSSHARQQVVCDGKKCVVYAPEILALGFLRELVGSFREGVVNIIPAHARETYGVASVARLGQLLA